jgi:phosphate transport system permease protein
VSAVPAPAGRAIDASNARYRSRRQVNFVLLAVSALAVAFGLFWLVWILGTLLYEGGYALARAMAGSPTRSPEA